MDGSLHILPVSSENQSYIEHDEAEQYESHPLRLSRAEDEGSTLGQKISLTV